MAASALVTVMLWFPVLDAANAGVPAKLAEAVVVPAAGAVNRAVATPLRLVTAVMAADPRCRTTGTPATPLPGAVSRAATVTADPDGTLDGPR